MSKCRVVNAEPVDAMMFTPLPCYDGGAQDRVLKQLANGCLEAFTLLSPEGHVLGIVYASLMFKHSATFCALFSNEMPKYPKFTHKFIKTIIEPLMKKHGLSRVQTFVNVGNEAAIKQNYALGFKKEGILVNFGPCGEDQYIFARYA